MSVRVAKSAGFCFGVSRAVELVEQAALAGKKVGVVDERSEIAACYRGIPQNDLGPRTDVLDNCPKEHGIHMLLRSMSPQIIAVEPCVQEPFGGYFQKTAAFLQEMLNLYHEISQGRYRSESYL